MDIKAYWDAVAKQDAERLREFFKGTACINWHCTNEHFTVEEFIRANCEYPGSWEVEVERIEQAGDLMITAARVFSSDGLSFHAVSFIKLEDGKIASIDEYWGDDGPAPQWRLDKHIGTSIK